MIRSAFLCLACLLTFLPRRSGAATITGGEVILRFDEAALASINHGTDPAIPALVLEEFFTGQDDASRTASQIQFDQIVPGYTQIPATDLHLGINGPAPVNMTGRYSQATDLSFDPWNVEATVTGKIGIRGMMRFIGDFTGVFIIGDLALHYDAARVNATTGRSGWYFRNNSYNFRIGAFETRNVTLTLAPGSLKLTGTLMIAPQLANAFFPGDEGKVVGTFEVRATMPGLDSMPLELVPVGNEGNAPDPATGFGSVAYPYRIGATEVTNAQFARFLNAVDPDGTNPHGLYNANMSDDTAVVKGGLDYLPAAPSGQKYAPKPAWANKPVNYVGFHDAARFCNWLTTGDTERGFYTFSGTTVISAEGPYGPAFGAPYCALPGEDEWYKAAYHKNNGTAADYFLYATSSDTLPAVAASLANGDIANPGANVANYDFGATWHDTEGLGNMTTVGSAGPLSTSPYGTHDQAGNQWEWCGAFIAQNRVMRGGSLWSPGDTMRSTHRASFFPESGGSSLGFRISTTFPEPSWSPPALAISVAPGAGNGTPILFQSRADTDYRFDYSADLRLWHRVHLPVSGNGQLLEVPVPSSARTGGKIFVRAVMWRR